MTKVRVVFTVKIHAIADTSRRNRSRSVAFNCIGRSPFVSDRTQSQLFSHFRSLGKSRSQLLSRLLPTLSLSISILVLFISSRFTIISQQFSIPFSFLASRVLIALYFALFRQSVFKVQLVGDVVMCLIEIALVWVSF